jgi:hypothetical protein
MAPIGYIHAICDYPMRKCPMVAFRQLPFPSMIGKMTISRRYESGAKSSQGYLSDRNSNWEMKADCRQSGNNTGDDLVRGSAGI